MRIVRVISKAARFSFWSRNEEVPSVNYALRSAFGSVARLPGFRVRIAVLEC